MASLNIIRVPNPILKKKSKRVTKIDNKLENLAFAMADTIENYQTDIEAGVAMAAVQVGEPIRMIVIREDDGSYVAVINPEITKRYGDIKEDLEGCLSVPGVYGLVERHDKVNIKGTTIDNKCFKLETSGILARILQHEIDHLDGILFTDRIKDLSKLYKTDKQGRLISREGKIVDEISREY